MVIDGLKVGILLGGLGLVLAIAMPSAAQQARTEVLAEIDGQKVEAWGSGLEI